MGVPPCINHPAGAQLTIANWNPLSPPTIHGIHIQRAHGRGDVSHIILRVVADVKDLISGAKGWEITEPRGLNGKNHGKISYKWEKSWENQL